MVSSIVAHRSSVDLPEPEGPMMETTSPSLTEREISFRISTPSKLFFICSICSRILPSSLIVFLHLLLIVIQTLLDPFHHRCHDQVEQIIKHACDHERHDTCLLGCDLLCHGKHFCLSQHKGK